MLNGAPSVPVKIAAAHFYDMRRTPIICPKCGTTFNPKALLRGRRQQGGKR
jgi:hypothetical protein